MGKTVIAVDAGYFWVQLTHVLLGKRGARHEIEINYERLREEILQCALQEFPNAELLRVYWYDGPNPDGSKNISHAEIDNLDDFKLRLGVRNGVGNQKAVDGLIIADLIGLAQSKSISEVILVSGDADLTPGVSAIQNLGIRVHLLSLGPKSSTSSLLRAEVDKKFYWDASIITKFCSHALKDNVTLNLCESIGNEESDFYMLTIEEVVSILGADYIKNLSHTNNNWQVPKEIDSKLLVTAKKYRKKYLDENEKVTLRKRFKSYVKNTIK